MNFNLSGFFQIFSTIDYGCIVVIAILKNSSFVNELWHYHHINSYKFILKNWVEDDLTNLKLTRDKKRKKRKNSMINSEAVKTVFFYKEEHVPVSILLVEFPSLASRWAIACVGPWVSQGEWNHLRSTRANRWMSAFPSWKWSDTPRAAKLDTPPLLKDRPVQRHCYALLCPERINHAHFSLYLNYYYNSSI